MIDFHTHILPSIDDGSKNKEQTINLLKEAEQAGFDKIILTPHYIEDYYETNEAERKSLLENVARNTSLELYLANEIYMSGNIIQLLQAQEASTINNTRYILFEMPMNSQPLNLYDVIYEIQQHKLVPVLAHPERYSFVQSNPELVYDLIQKGVLMQQNYGSIIGQYGKRAQIIAKNMLINNMVHFLGSDVHGPNTIYKNIPQILTKLENIIGEEKLYELTTENPALVLENKSIDIKSPTKIRLSFKDKLEMKFNKK